jgi:hypothetical protein
LQQAIIGADINKISIDTIISLLIEGGIHELLNRIHESSSMTQSLPSTAK